MDYSNCEHKGINEEIEKYFPLEIAGYDVLTNIKTLGCDCGCNICVLEGKVYYNAPKSRAEIMDVLNSIAEDLKLK